MPLESCVIVPVSEAEAVVDDLRWQYDPMARNGIPAHITLIYPFEHPSSVSIAIGDLRQLFSRVSAFPFSLAEVRRFDDGTAYLHPEPSALFVDLTETLVKRWPEFPPYRGEFPTVTPHLTVAHKVGTRVLDAVTMTVAGRLPVHCDATEAWLMCSDERGSWTRREAFRFAA